MAINVTGVMPTALGLGEQLTIYGTDLNLVEGVSVQNNETGEFIGFLTEISHTATQIVVVIPTNLDLGPCHIALYDANVPVYYHFYSTVFHVIAPEKVQGLAFQINFHNTPSSGVYPDGALPFLTDYPTPLVSGSIKTPNQSPAFQYRDAYTGDLLNLHPYTPSPESSGGGDAGYGPATMGGEDLYVCGWFTRSVWHVRSDGTTVWRRGGTAQAPLADWNPYGSSQIQGVITPYNGEFIFQDEPTFPSLKVVDPDNGDILWTRTLSVARYFQGGSLVYHPDGTLLGMSTDAATRGIWRINLSTGVVTLWKSIASIDAAYSRGYFMAAHPGGDGLAVTVDNGLAGSSRRSAIYELSWSGAVGNKYVTGTVGAGSGDPFIYAISYSPDGNYLYSVGDWTDLVYRWERGPGDVGGDEPWLNLNYATRADWIADGSSSGAGPNAYWSCTTGGLAIAVFEPLAFGEPTFRTLLRLKQPDHEVRQRQRQFDLRMKQRVAH